MTLWQRFREWIGCWFIHDCAAKSGVALTAGPGVTPTPAAPVPAAPAPAAPTPAAPTPAAPAPALIPSNPVQNTLSTAESVVRLLGTAVSALKNTGLLGGGNTRQSLPAFDSDSESPSDTSSSFAEPDFINDSSDVVD